MTHFILTSLDSSELNNLVKFFSAEKYLVRKKQIVFYYFLVGFPEKLVDLELTYCSLTCNMKNGSSSLIDVYSKNVFLTLGVS